MRFQASQARLIASAREHGIAAAIGWNRLLLEATPFYREHAHILNHPRGSGYWLWKPFIVMDALLAVPENDIVAYSDAGMEVVGDLTPLVGLCVDMDGILLFAGHYEDWGEPGRYTCGRWTKRDCFVLMHCDEPRYHDGAMIDASFMMIRNNPRTRAVVREWLARCTDPRLLTDQPNVCGLPNHPGYRDHRHDQSILSLLAIRERIELFRHPSQYGNHLKLEAYRRSGEWTRLPYARQGIFVNSPYGTLLNHHRGRLSPHQSCPAAMSPDAAARCRDSTLS